jgi:hypothetical protein
LRIFIVCGDPECGEEYPADTGDKRWLCPHCGRERPNKYYPFLTARLMNAKIHADETDWKEHHDDLLSTARRKIEDLRDHIELLRRDLKRLRIRLPEEKRGQFDPLMDGVEVASFLDGWSTEAPEKDREAWRDLHDRLLEGVREEVLALEETAKRMEDGIRGMKTELGLA